MTLPILFWLSVRLVWIVKSFFTSSGLAKCIRICSIRSIDGNPVVSALSRYQIRPFARKKDHTYMTATSRAALHGRLNQMGMVLIRPSWHMGLRIVNKNDKLESGGRTWCVISGKIMARRRRMKCLMNEIQESMHVFKTPSWAFWILRESDRGVAMAVNGRVASTFQHVDGKTPISN